MHVSQIVIICPSCRGKHTAGYQDKELVSYEISDSFSSCRSCALLLADALEVDVLDE